MNEYRKFIIEVCPIPGKESETEIVMTEEREDGIKSMVCGLHDIVTKLICEFDK